MPTAKWCMEDHFPRCTIGEKADGMDLLHSQYNDRVSHFSSEPHKLMPLSLELTHAPQSAPELPIVELTTS
jgi:hypothetical protein